MNIDLHIITRNEEQMLPFTLMHYEKFCSRIFIWDNMSTDQTTAIAKAHPKIAMVATFDMGGVIDDSRYTQIKNDCWKSSDADFVIVCDCDELLYLENIMEHLTRLKNDKHHYSLPCVEGFNMYSEDFPEDYSVPITEQVKMGVREPMFDKQIIFDPKAVREINFQDGAHHCHPVGRVVSNTASSVYPPLLLLHYKYLDRSRVKMRFKDYASRLSEYNIRTMGGNEYLLGDKYVDQRFDELKQKSILVVK